jgi:hypothetical protein
MAWVPCARTAEEGSRFCVMHARAIEGAMLGALMHAEARNEAVTLVEDLRPWIRGRRKGCESAALTAGSRGSEKRKSF